MNVFVLNTGRCGSTTFAKACQHLSNYTAAHESRVLKLGKSRVAYPSDHIEVDNRLSWFLGALDEEYGKDAFYVHLKRDRETTIQSYLHRFKFPESIMTAFSKGIQMYGDRTLDQKLKYELCAQYYDTVNSNIRLFLKDKDNSMTIHLEDILNQFPIFLKWIKAEGDLKAAGDVWNTSHNTTKDFKKKIKSKSAKITLKEWYNKVKNAILSN